jgi:hypothetical protein
MLFLNEGILELQRWCDIKRHDVHTGFRENPLLFEKSFGGERYRWKDKNDDTIRLTFVVK